MQSSHVEVVVSNVGMLFGFVVVGAVAVLGAYLAFAKLGGVGGWVAGILAVLVAIVALGSLGAAVYGRYVGTPWLFTP